jgi:hypothetical protein
MFFLGGQAEVQAAYEEEFAAYEAGLYREQPRDWLATSWQGDALQVSPSYIHAVLPAPDMASSSALLLCGTCGLCAWDSSITAKK